MQILNDLEDFIDSFNFFNMSYVFGLTSGSETLGYNLQITNHTFRKGISHQMQHTCDV